MTDDELNLAIHQEVEGWQEAEWGALRWTRNDERTWCHDVPDYCHDPAWCVAMMEKYRLNAYAMPKKWEVTRYGSLICEANSLTRAVALAVLALHREGK